MIGCNVRFGPGADLRLAGVDVRYLLVPDIHWERRGRSPVTQRERPLFASNLSLFRLAGNSTRIRDDRDAEVAQTSTSLVSAGP